MNPSSAVLLSLLAAFLDSATAFQLAPLALRSRGAAYGLTPALSICGPLVTADGLARAARSRRCRAASGVQGMQAQQELVASLASGATSLSGAAVLCGVIAFHEMGHFLAAKVQGIRINDFSIGFGPKLLGWTDKEGITYSFRLFPLGGYVSFPEGLEEDEETPEGAEKIAAGSNSGESDEKKEKVYSFDDPDLIQNRPAAQRALVISAGVIFNMILSYTAIFGSVTTIGISTPVMMPGVAVPGIADPNGAAARSGLMAGDVIIQVDGEDVLSGDDATRTVVNAVKDSKGRTLHFMVQRPGSDPDELEEVNIVPDKNINGDGVIGVRLSSNVASVNVVFPKGPGNAIEMTNHEFGKLFSATAAGFVKLFSNLGANAGNLAGPVGVMQMGAEAGKQGALLTFAALISLNLGLMNAIPLPALDGGQLLLIMVEAARGKPLNADLTRTVNGVFLTLLLCVSLSLLIGDIERLIPPSVITGIENLLGLPPSP